MGERKEVEEYQAFLDTKRIKAQSVGFDIDPSAIHEVLYPFQRDIVQWALARGRAAVFADCGLGKTLVQLEWAKHVAAHTAGTVLILAPLAVAQQTVREGLKIGLAVHSCRESAGVVAGAVNIANYEMLHKFDAGAFAAIVLDESSILKAFDGVYRKALTEFCQTIPFRLACTATPAPNDLIEITNHAEFLGIMSGKEIIALFFRQDGNTTHAWRLKGHARKAFWEWMATWSVACRSPQDLGYDDDRFVLPSIQYHEHRTATSGDTNGYLFPMEASTLMERKAARRESTSERVSMAAEIVAREPGESWIVWCGLNAESQALAKEIPGAVEVTGSDSVEHKEKSLLGFASGEIRVLVSKCSIAGFGMNFQVCARELFVGLSDSWEEFYQATRRCWRFGQKREVHAHIVIAETEGAVLENIKRKEVQAADMFSEIVAHMRGLNLVRQERNEMEYTTRVTTGPGWTLYNGDCVEMMDNIADNSVGLSVFSPPFPGMYAYTNSPRDIGNCDEINTMIQHFRFLVGREKLWRVLMPGRICCIHLMQLTAMKSRDGYIGLKDYRGRVIDMMGEEGWVYAGEVCIDKNPQVQAVRNKERGLLFKSLATDAAMMRMALADYLIYFRKPGENPEPIHAGISAKYGDGEGWISEAEWIEWAAPVWYRRTKHIPGGIAETDILGSGSGSAPKTAGSRDAKGEDDERHICPLQLGVIERAVKLWSNPGDLVLSPFAGIGSEGYTALKFNRQFVGIELKPEYAAVAVKNLTRALADKEQVDMVDMAAAASQSVA